MKKSSLVVAVLLLATLAPASVQAGRRASAPALPTPEQIGMLVFGTMFGVDGVFLGEEHAIRGVVGDELPWEIKSGIGRLGLDGRLTIQVHGLVFKDDPSVPPELRGINDEEEFRALVSCLDEDGNVANVVTAGFPATRSGNSLIDAQLHLPGTCVAPIIFVLSGSEDKWFSVTGIEGEN